MNEHYKKYVEQAFIDPIRSVIIVDDDYPTIDEILDTQLKVKAGNKSESNKSWRDKPQLIKDVIAEFRSGEKPYMLDIHDAQNMTVDNELSGAAHLHQTDLLILDYELDRDKQGDWTRSLKIAQKLMSNSHFNLIVVHTNNDLDTVFQNFLRGLLSPFLDELTKQEETRLEKAYDELGEAPDFTTELEKSFGFAQYSAVWRNDKLLRNIAAGEAPFVSAKKLFEGVGLPKPHWPLMAKSALISYQDSIAKKFMSPENLGIKSFADSVDVKWIRSDKAFIAFSHKPAGKKLLDSLRAALHDWNPKPSRLLLTKMLAEIDEHGIEMQDIATRDNHSSALWYQKLLDSDSHQINSRVEETVRHHVDSMLTRLLPEIRQFAADLAKDEKKPTQCANIEVVQEHYGVDLSDEKEKIRAQLSHNALVCCQEPLGWHLQSGHIFELDKALWVCVSPLCDTVPSQISSSQLKIQGDRLRINAIRLHKMGLNKLPDDVQSNRYIFLRTDKGIQVYSLTENANAMPDWTTFFAAQKGEFTTDMHFSLSRIEQDPKSKELVTKLYETQVIGHLRYEYTLNLIQRLGGSLTRVGLDFSG